MMMILLLFISPATVGVRAMAGILLAWLQPWVRLYHDTRADPLTGGAPGETGAGMGIASTVGAERLGVVVERHRE
jgi:hypothetical protein